MVIVLSSSAVDRSQTKDYKIGIYYFSAKHAASMRTGTYWLAKTQDNGFKWGDISIPRLLFQWASTMKISWACFSSTEWTLSSFH
jgi:hypothetical protein